MGRPRSTNRRSFPPNLYCNAAGYYSWRDPDDGKVHGLGRDKATAFAEARAANALVAARTPKTLVERLRSDRKLTRDWVAEWLEDAKEGKAKSTVANWKSATRELVATCGHIPIDEVTPKMVAGIIKGYADAGKDRMAEMVRDTLLDVFRAAIVQGHLGVGKNPVEPTEAERGKVKRVRLSLDDFMAIHKSQISHWGRLGMELALVSAQRRSDVAGMKRSDIVDGHIQVDQRKSGGAVKLGIPLSLRLDAVGWSLGEIIERCKTAGLISPHILHHRRKGANYHPGSPIDPDGLSKKFSQSFVRAGLPVEAGRRAPTYHEIRSLAIRLWTAQAGKEFAKTLAGHKNMKTTLLYSDPRDSEVKRIMVPDPNSPEFRTNIE